MVLKNPTPCTTDKYSKNTQETIGKSIVVLKIFTKKTEKNLMPQSKLNIGTFIPLKLCYNREKKKKSRQTYIYVLKRKNVHNT